MSGLISEGAVAAFHCSSRAMVRQAITETRDSQAAAVTEIANTQVTAG
jgi:hypothetical protein